MQTLGLFVGDCTVFPGKNDSPRKEGDERPTVTVCRNHPEKPRKGPLAQSPHEQYLLQARHCARLWK